MVTFEVPGCLVLRHPEDWTKRVDELRSFQGPQLPMELVMFTSRSHRTKCDGQGRVRIEGQLLERIGLVPGDKVKVVGSAGLITLWGRDAWQEVEAKGGSS